MRIEIEWGNGFTQNVVSIDNQLSQIKSIPYEPSRFIWIIIRRFHNHSLLELRCGMAHNEAACPQTELLFMELMCHAICVEGRPPAALSQGQTAFSLTSSASSQ
jgi:hypothetical protein